MIDGERDRARARDREIRSRLDGPIAELTPAGRFELLSYVMTLLVQDAAHGLRELVAEPAPIGRSGEGEEARKPLPVHTRLELPQRSSTTQDKPTTEEDSK